MLNYQNVFNSVFGMLSQAFTLFSQIWSSIPWYVPILIGLVFVNFIVCKLYLPAFGGPVSPLVGFSPSERDPYPDPEPNNPYFLWPEDHSGGALVVYRGSGSLRKR